MSFDSLPKVSIIISAYNGGRILSKTLPRILDQNYPKGLIEIIVVNDCSVDNTLSVLESYKNQITIINHETNKGRCATRNSGIKAARGNVLLFLDCDIEVDNEYVSKHVSRLNNPNVIGVVSKLTPPSNVRLDKYQLYYFFGRRGAKIAPQDKPLPFKYFIMGCASIRREAVVSTGLFNEIMAGYGVDLEYSYRLSRHYPAGFVYGDDIATIVHNVKPLHQACADFRNYGKHNIPILLKQFPELAPLVAADFVMCTDLRSLWKFILGLLFMNTVIEQFARKSLTILPFPISNFFVRYLLAANAAIGYKSYLKSRNE